VLLGLIVALAVAFTIHWGISYCRAAIWSAYNRELSEEVRSLAGLDKEGNEPNSCSRIWMLLDHQAPVGALLLQDSYLAELSRPSPRRSFQRPVSARAHGMHPFCRRRARSQASKRPPISRKSTPVVLDSESPILCLDAK
jgi:hypothetical protein